MDRECLEKSKRRQVVNAENRGKQTRLNKLWVKRIVGTPNTGTRGNNHGTLGIVGKFRSWGRGQSGGESRGRSEHVASNGRVRGYNRLVASRTGLVVSNEGDPGNGRFASK